MLRMKYRFKDEYNSELEWCKPIEMPHRPLVETAMGEGVAGPRILPGRLQPSNSPPPLARQKQRALLVSYLQQRLLRSVGWNLKGESTPAPTGRAWPA